MTTSPPGRTSERPVVGRDGRPLPDHVTLPLLDRLLVESLDQDYLVAAATRRRTGEDAGSETGRGTGRRLGRGTAVAVGAFGLILAVAGVQTWRDAPITASDRAALIDQVGRENAAADVQQRTLRALKRQTTALQASTSALSQQVGTATARASRLAARTGYAAVSGPGVRAVADDAPGGGDDARIRDEDLAQLVDGLWSAGATAISINGNRLTALSPIRTSGVAIHVAFQPVSPPYTVLALGDTATLQSRFAETTHGLAWLALRNTFGFRFSMHNEDDLHLPAAPYPVLRAAEQAGTPQKGGSS